MIAIMVFDFKQNRDWAAHLQIVFQLGLTMVGCIAFCFFIGRYLDLWLGTRGLMVTIFTILGVIGGAVTAYRQIIETLDSEKKDRDNL
jgi:F0F1-type ATP synthase assembly protein I